MLWEMGGLQSKETLKKNNITVKGNIRSKIYHLSHCGSFNTVSEKNAVFFKSEGEAKKNGYRKAKNCSD